MMRTYDSYKDSGIEWIGEIPRHWEVKKLKYLFKCKKSENGQLLTTEYVGENPGEYPVYSGQTENNGILGCINQYDYNYDYHIIFTTTVGAKVMTSRLLIGKFSLSQNCMIMVPLYNYISKYIHYFISYDWIFRRELLPVILQPSLRIDDVNHFFSLLPPLSEQKQIVSYLDEKTSLIDEMVEKKKRKIELLKEYRTSLINTVVTKGLNPDVPMKDSGIEWIGEIPDEWVNSKLKYISKIIGRIGYRGYTVDDLVDEGQGVITLSPSNIVDGELNLEKRTFLSYEKYYESPEIIIEHDDIIYVQRGSTIGKSSIIPINHPEMTINPQLVIMKKFNCIPRFIYYFLKSEVITTQTNIQISGGSTPLITQNSVECFIVVLPKSKEEQEQIVSYLDEKTSEIDKTIELENKKIELLKEYRQSLISNVVTGKIKVVSE